MSEHKGLWTSPFLKKAYLNKVHCLKTNFCRLLIIFSNNLDPDQDRQSMGSDLDSNCWTYESVLNDFF